MTTEERIADLEKLHHQEPVRSGELLKALRQLDQLGRETAAMREAHAVDNTRLLNDVEKRRKLVALWIGEYKHARDEADKWKRWYEQKSQEAIGLEFIQQTERLEAELREQIEKGRQWNELLELELASLRLLYEPADFEEWFASFRAEGADPLPLWVAEKMKTAWDASAAALVRLGGGCGAEAGRCAPTTESNLTWGLTELEEKIARIAANALVEAGETDP